MDKIIKSLADIQPLIMNCYAGSDKEMFNEIVPTCSRCDLLAIDPRKCFLCEEEVICGNCHDT